jgi:signal transduction histidine kinase
MVFELISTPLQTADGTRVWLEVFRDITERKRTEEALRDADQRKNNSLAFIAHELRSPLTSIINAIQVLRRLESHETQIRKKKQDLIEQQSWQMVHLIDDLLDVSKIIHGMIKLHCQKIDLAKIIESAVDLNRPLVENLQHSFSVVLPSKPILLNVDPLRFRQVLTNLLENACKYTAPGGKIQLLVEPREEKKELRVSISDNGAGIAPENLKQIFELFVQFDSSNSRPQRGLGVGLALTKKLVELHGGTIEVYSAGIGQGSQFVITLPLGIRH